MILFLSFHSFKCFKLSHWFYNEFRLRREYIPKQQQQQQKRSKKKDVEINNNRINEWKLVEEEESTLYKGFEKKEFFLRPIKKYKWKIIENKIKRKPFFATEQKVANMR